MRASVRTLCSPFSAHSHTTIRFHPSFCQAASLRLSRFTFRDHFCIQNDTLLFGIEEEEQPCRCQKQAGKRQEEDFSHADHILYGQKQLRRL